jgi:ubiquinone/menaquinone biosynthesis C-methylase UbiE
MNSRHSKVTDWGLSHASIAKQDIVLDVGCGGGGTISRLAAVATQGKVYGIDHSKESVAVAMRTNKQWIDIARVEIREASISRLPAPAGHMQTHEVASRYGCFEQTTAGMNDPASDRHVCAAHLLPT